MAQGDNEGLCRAAGSAKPAPRPVTAQVEQGLMGSIGKTRGQDRVSARGDKREARAVGAGQGAPSSISSRTVAPPRTRPTSHGCVQESYGTPASASFSVGGKVRRGGEDQGGGPVRGVGR